MPVGVGRIQRNAIVDMMMNEDTSASAGRFCNLDKVAPVLA